MEEDELVITAVGDVIVNRDDPASMFESVGMVLKAADITFGNSETPYSEGAIASKNPIAAATLNSEPSNAVALRESAGFDVMSFANNHHLDQGYTSFLRTLDVLRGLGIATCGAGKDIIEARGPAVVEAKGMRVAFLAYTSIIPRGFEAGLDKPGAAPLRIYTHYDQWEHEQPGTAPHILTFADKSDLRAMEEDISNAKELADIVIVSMHKGLHFVRAALADYEGEIARAAIDAGADAILGHHQHILKGVEWYKERVIFHGLGNFAMDLPNLQDPKDPASSPHMRMIFENYGGEVGYHEDYPTYYYSVDARKTVIAKLIVSRGAISRVSFHPCHISPDHSPLLLDPIDPMFAEVAGYVEQVTAEAELQSTFEIVGNEVRVTAGTDDKGLSHSAARGYRGQVATAER